MSAPSRSSSYQTLARQLILQCLGENSESTATAEDIEVFLAGKEQKINRATVYRNLERLVSEGLVLKFPSDKGRKSCYQLAETHEHGSDCHDHLHLKCSECGKVIHLDCHFMDEFSEHIQNEHGFSMNFENSIINGLCDDCRRKRS